MTEEERLSSKVPSLTSPTMGTSKNLGIGFAIRFWNGRAEIVLVLVLEGTVVTLPTVAIVVLISVAVLKGKLLMLFN